MSGESKETVTKLSQQLRSLKVQLDSSNNEAKRWAEKRDAIHKQIRDLRLEAAKARKRRDSINAKVKILKTQRERMLGLRKEKKENSRLLLNKLILLNQKKPRQAASVLMEEKEKIEWAIQTTSLTLLEEKPLVERANQLEIKLKIYRQISVIKEKIAKSKEEIKEASEKADLYHAELSELAPLSQEIHEKMLGNIHKAEELQIEADLKHQNFLQHKQESEKILKQHIEVESKIRVLKKESAEAEESERMLRLENTRKKLRAEALRKLERGEKLTLDEFKLLAKEETA
ncbi:MAG: hypothetical protein JSV51_04960 [Candidatus Bathyarchaeota archaeon]|nr:MAG: hypothetical protein JSV51_04960 [Candidatus Bathyarchaeota archaeon]